MKLKYPPVKKFLRNLYRLVNGIQVLISSKKQSKKINVYYGGSLKGNVGGGLVKIKRLSEYFPNNTKEFNVVYLLSNSQYLPKYGINLIKKRGIPIIHNQNGVFYPGWYDGDWRKENKRMAFSHANADYVFYQSIFSKRSAEKYLGTRNGSSEILYNAVDLQHFLPKKNKKTGKQVRFLMTGKFYSHVFYKIDSALRGIKHALTLGLNCELIIAGWMDDLSKQKAHKLISELGIPESVEILGRYRQEDAPQIYNSSDIYITTSHNDPCPNAVIEALACGLPVIHTSTGGTPELVGSEAGIKIITRENWNYNEVPDAIELGQSMVRIVDQIEDKKINARYRAEEKFDIFNWVDKHRMVFESFLGKN